MLGYTASRRLLTLFSILSLLTSACLLVGAVVFPIPSNEPEAVRSVTNGRPNKATPEVSVDENQLSLAAFADAWHKRLHRPLVDPPPSQPKIVAPRATLPAQSPPPRKLQVRLIGTLVDADPTKCIAWVQVETNPIQIVRTGEVIDQTPATINVMSIGDKQLLLSINGSQKLISMEQRTLLRPPWIEDNL